MKSARNTLLALATLCLPCAHALEADVILLRPGRVEGKVVRSTATTVTIRTATGLRTFKKEDVERVIYDIDPEEQRKKTGGSDDDISPVVASALLPGWGQWAQGRRVTGATYGTLFGLALWNFQRAGRAYGKTIRQYEKVADPNSDQNLAIAFTGSSIYLGGTGALSESVLPAYDFQQYRHATARAYGSYRSSAYLLLAVYGLNLLDAYYFDPIAQKKRGARPRATARSPLQRVMYSAMLPGLGQWRAGHRGRGALTGLMFGVAVINVLQARRAYVRSSDSLGSLFNPFTDQGYALSLTGAYPNSASVTTPLAALVSSRPFDDQRAATDRNFRRLQAAGYGALLIYLWNLADAYFLSGVESKASGRASGTWKVQFAPLLATQDELHDNRAEGSSTGWRLGATLRF